MFGRLSIEMVEAPTSRLFDHRLAQNQGLDPASPAYNRRRPPA